LDDDGSCACGGEAGLVGHDVVDGVGCRLGCVEDDVAHELAVEKCFDAEVEISLWAGDRCTEVVVGVADGDSIAAARKRVQAKTVMPREAPMARMFVDCRDYPSEVEDNFLSFRRGVKCARL
jgi:hypothetical protein